MPKGSGIRDSNGRFIALSEDERKKRRKESVQKWYANPENRERIQEKRNLARKLNRETNLEYYKQYREKNIEFIQAAKVKYRMKNRHLINLRERCKRHNISIQSFLEMLEKQDYTCAICKGKFVHDPNTWNSIHVDHCHKLNLVRGLLCGTCNKGLGQFKENSSILFNAGKYLLLFDKEVELV